MARVTLRRNLLTGNDPNAPSLDSTMIGALAGACGTCASTGTKDQARNAS